MNGSICLDVVEVFAGNTELVGGTVGGAHDSRCDCVRQSERAAHSHHELSWMYSCRVTQTQHG